MSGELWAIIGVVIGALTTGAMNMWHAKRQRKWSAEDADRAADRAWNHEKRSRLFEAKRSAHETFTQALHGVHGLVLETLEYKKAPIVDHPDYGSAMMELMRAGAHVQVYGSRDASTAARDAADAMATYCGALGPDSTFNQPRTAYHKALSRYLYIARLDVAAEESDLTLDDLKAMPSQQEDEVPE